MIDDETMSTAKLKGSFVKRTGRTARYWGIGTGTRDIDLKAEGSEILFSFEIPSKGGGYTCLELRVPATDFPALLKAMCAASAAPALLKAISAANPRTAPLVLWAELRRTIAEQQRKLNARASGKPRGEV
jgi:hypothetical protein